MVAQLMGWGAWLFAMVNPTVLWILLLGGVLLLYMERIVSADKKAGIEEAAFWLVCVSFVCMIGIRFFEGMVFAWSATAWYIPVVLLLGLVLWDRLGVSGWLKKLAPPASKAKA